MSKTVITSPNAPAAIGTYSQAIKAGNTVYLSGQIPLDPKTMELVEGFEEQTVQVFENLKAVIEASGGYLHDVAKLNIFLTDLGNFATVNEVMSRYCQQPYPARAANTVPILSASYSALLSRLRALISAPVDTARCVILFLLIFSLRNDVPASISACFCITFR